MKCLKQAEIFKHMRANWAKGIGKPRAQAAAKGKGAAKGRSGAR